MPIKNWSTTPGSNTSAPPAGAPESSTKLKDVNDILRQMMADVRTLAAPATVASAATTDLGASDETILTVSGTTTITAFGTVSAGIWKFVTFSGALTLTHNATSLILLGGANRTTVAGDCGLYVSLGSGNWKEYFYSPITTASYQPLHANLTALSGGNATIAWPIGSVYTSIVATNPATLLGGGTWVSFGAGRVLVGLDAAQTEFDTVEETGGAKTHTLTAAEIPAHSHTQRNTGSGTTLNQIANGGGTSAVVNSEISTADTGGGSAHNNLQPYIVVYFWKRTA